MKKTLITVGLLLAILVGCATETNQVEGSFHSPKRGSTFVKKEKLVIRREETNIYSQGIDPETGLYIVDNPDSIMVYVNKMRELPEGYAPPDLTEADVLYYAPVGDNRRLMREEAATALEKMFQTADQEGYTLVAVSGYRTYDRQRVIYESNVANNGQAHADRYSAKPGTSEHQTGLAMDVSVQGNDAVLLEQGFGGTDAGMWVKENAHRFGFIVRYPEGKTAITGYSYEPWHLRYVGNEIAEDIYNRGITLEEYFGFHYPGSEEEEN
ncbi:D-Ala-D-Ala carboxypeptidase [Streptohalobacillus salinus]|uniref:D-Ala-D-Ala carboxypeptidase n=1 Tax=Streptohalobacillus salinus TaxID=621096 RepID=A0A2V3WGT2_9BACI|nr:M15 family metallopeptidase [Streptohalobacillus salinus]PXW93059.1 D-Ala-D-Ala carboxypeptidase [Streptohalobacillus salinus]